MPARAGVLIAAVTALAFLNGWARSAWAACAAPVVGVTPTAVEPGTQIVVRGEGFMAECNDVVVCDVGGECDERRAEPVPFVEVVFEQEGAQEVLGRATPEPSLSFSVTVEVPVRAEPGAAFVVVIPAAGGLSAEPVPLTVEAAGVPTEDSPASNRDAGEPVATSDSLHGDEEAAKSAVVDGGSSLPLILAGVSVLGLFGVAAVVIRRRVT